MSQIEEQAKKASMPVTAKILADQWQQIVKQHPDAVVVIDGKVMSQASWAKHSGDEVTLVFVPVRKGKANEQAK